MLGGVLVDESGSGAGVSEAGHEFFGGGSSLGGQGGAGVTEVVEMNVAGQPGCAASPVPRARRIGARGYPTAGRNEEGSGGVGGGSERPCTARTKSGSPIKARKRPSAWLPAGWLSASRSAASVTDRV